MNEVNEGYSVAETLNYTEKSNCVCKVEKFQHIKSVF